MYANAWVMSMSYDVLARPKAHLQETGVKVMLADASSRKLLAAYADCMSEGMCLIWSQSLWRPHFEEQQQQRFCAQSQMHAFTQAVQACVESQLLPSLTLNRLSSLFAFQVGEVHAAHCLRMNSCVTKPVALLCADLLAYRQNAVLVQHCCMIIHVQNQSLVTNIP